MKGTVMTLAVVLLAVTGCSSPGSAPATTPPSASAPTSAATSVPAAGAASSSAFQPQPSISVQPVSVDRADPDAVTRAFTTLVWSFDARTDRGPLAAQTRAAQLASPAYAAVLRSGSGSGGAAWLTLTKRHGWTTATAEVSTAGPDAPDSATMAYREAIVSIVAQDGAGWSDKALFQPVGMSVRLVKMDGAWWVDATTTSLGKGE